MLRAVAFITLVGTLYATEQVTHPTYKTLERYLEALCGAYTNMDKVRAKALEDITKTLEKKGLEAGEGPIECLDDGNLYCLYVFQKRKGRIQAYAITHNAKEKTTFAQSTTPSRSVQHVFNHHKARTQGRTPYDHIQRPITHLWSTQKKGRIMGLLLSVALAKKVLSPEQERMLGGSLASLLQGSAWNGLVGGVGMWFMDGHTFTLRVPALFRKTKGVIDCTFVLQLERTGMYTASLKHEPFWRER